MQKIVTLLVALLLIGGCAGTSKSNFAKNYNPEAKRTMAVLPFSGALNKRIDPAALTDMVMTEMTGAKNITVVDRVSVDKVMTELAFQQSGVVDETTRTRLGQLGADTILSGTLHTYEENRRDDGFVIFADVHFTARLLSVGTGEVLWSGDYSDSSKGRNIGDKRPIIGEVSARSAREIVGKLIGNMGTELKGETLMNKLKDVLPAKKGK